MSITKEIKIPNLPLAVGLILSATIALQPAALPVFAQDAVVQEESGAPQIDGIMALGGGEMEGNMPQVLGLMSIPQSEEFAVGEGGPEHHHHGFSEANKMTDDQYERLYAIKEDVEDQMGIKRAQEHILHRKLKDVLSASSIDTKAAQDLASKITALKSEMTQLKLDSMIRAAQVFTPEQRRELRLMMIKGHHHHHGGHHGWGGHMGHEHHGGPGGPGGHEGHGGPG